MVRNVAEADHDSIVSLIRDLVRIPTRGGLDPYDGIIDYVSHWLEDHGLPSRKLYDQLTGRAIAVVCDVTGKYPGPRYVLDACLDTAPFGDPAAWRHSPTSAAIESGWLYGRGSADSKAAIAIFMHIANHLREHVDQMHGVLTLLFDADEHTGNFGGAKIYFSDGNTNHDVRGVMIGYPGIGELVVGGRGFLRAEMTVRGEAGHTGSQRTVNNINAVEKAAELVRVLTRSQPPGPFDSSLGLPPKLTVTGIAGGESYSIVPDRCTVSIDIRLTTTFDEAAGKKLIEDSATTIDERLSPSNGAATTVRFHESWPAYRLDEDVSIRVALTRAAQRYLDNGVTTKVAGPSNIGNYLAKLGIAATAGLGVNYQGLHGIDERIELTTIPTIQSIYHEAVLDLLSP